MTQVLIDTSVWIEHFKAAQESLLHIFKASQSGQIRILQHEMIVGELIVGGVPDKDKTIDLMLALPMLPRVTIEEFRVFVQNNDIIGSGITYVDINILASCKISNTKLLTYDKRLHKAATRLGLNYKTE